jgi:hypothetical protein
MAHKEHAPEFVLLEEAITVLFCEIDDAYPEHSTLMGAATRSP